MTTETTALTIAQQRAERAERAESKLREDLVKYRDAKMPVLRFACFFDKQFQGYVDELRVFIAKQSVELDKQSVELVNLSKRHSTTDWDCLKAYSVKIRNELQATNEREAKLRESLINVLPLAKGYAAKYDHKINREIIEDAEALAADTSTVSPAQSSGHGLKHE